MGVIGVMHGHIESFQQLSICILQSMPPIERRHFLHYFYHLVMPLSALPLYLNVAYTGHTVRFVNGAKLSNRGPLITDQYPACTCVLIRYVCKDGDELWRQRSSPCICARICCLLCVCRSTPSYCWGNGFESSLSRLKE